MSSSSNRAFISIGGVGAEGDAHEQHADAVADAVVSGRSAEKLTGADLDKATFDRATRWPQDFDPRSAGAIATDG